MVALGGRSIERGALRVLPRSLRSAAGARVRERERKPAAPVGMTGKKQGWTGGNVGAKAPTP